MHEYIIAAIADRIQRIILCICILLFCVFAAFGINYYIPKMLTQSWHCTQSRVIKESLPREEICVQYTKMEGK